MTTPDQHEVAAKAIWERGAPHDAPDWAALDDSDPAKAGCRLDARAAIDAYTNTLREAGADRAEDVEQLRGVAKDVLTWMEHGATPDGRQMLARRLSAALSAPLVREAEADSKRRCNCEAEGFANFEQRTAIREITAEADSIDGAEERLQEPTVWAVREHLRRIEGEARAAQGEWARTVAGIAHAALRELDDDGKRQGEFQRQLEQVQAERDSLRETLRYLADPESWGGDPRSHDAVLYGHDTPYELALAALSPPPEQQGEGDEAR